MKVAIVGGDGFIGRHVQVALDGRADFYVVDDMSSRKFSNETDCRCEVSMCEHPRFLDMTKHTREERSLAFESGTFDGKTDVVISMASKVSVEKSWDRPDEFITDNVAIAVNTVRAAIECAARRVVLTSSMSIYGEGGYAARETQDAKPLNPYGLGKLMQEKATAMLCEDAGIECVILRLWNTYGPGQKFGNPETGVVAIFCNAAMNGNPARVYGDGSALRDFVYVTDVARVIAEAAVGTSLKFGVRQKAKVLNVGSGTPTTVLAMANAAFEAFGVSPRVEHVASRIGDAYLSCPDTTALQEAIPGVRFRDLRTGLMEYARWVRQ